MKYILLILALLCSISSYSQIIARSTNTSNTLTDERLHIKRILGIPRYIDTTAANINKGEDSCGTIIYTYPNKMWIRSCSPKAWTEVGAGSITEVDPVSTHISDTSAMLFPYLRKSQAYSSYIDTSHTNHGMLTYLEGLYIYEKNAASISALSTVYYPLSSNPASYLTQTNTDALYSVLSHTHTFSSLTSKPTTLSGYGITDAVPSNRTITINGTTLDLSTNRSWTISTGISDTTPLSTRITTNVTAINDLRSRNINSGFGLSGGGDLSADRTLKVDSSTIQKKLGAGTNIAISGNTIYNTFDSSIQSSRITTNVTAINDNRASIALKAPIASPTFTGTVTLPASTSLVTPLLGTPTSGVLTNCTGYIGANLVLTDVTTNNATTSAHGFVPKLPNDATKYYDGTGSYSVPSFGNLTGAVTSVGLATSLGSFTSANLSTALTNETGTGAAVFQDQPVFTTSMTAPIIYGGSGSAGTLTLLSTSNATRGKVIFGNAATTAYDDVNDRLGIGTSSPSYKLHVKDGAITVDNSVTSSSGSLSVIGNSDGTNYASITFGRRDLTRYSYISHSSGDAIVLNHYNGTSFLKSAVFANTCDIFLGSTSLTATGSNAVLTVKAGGQVGVNNTSPATSAALEVNSTTKGFLLPRMTTAQRNAISSPVAGLEVFCTDCTATDASTGVTTTYNGSAWKNNW